MLVKFKLNGLSVELNVKPGEYLLDSLRNYGVKSVHKGCDGTSCGACTVLVDGKPILSCGYLTARAEGKEVTTVEGIQEEAAKLSEFFSKEGADQCGFCNPGLALLVHSLKATNPHPSDEEIKKYVVGNLCRCTGYQSQVNAIKAYLGGK